MSGESQLQPRQLHPRPDVLEGRLSGQERTLSVLLEQAFRIKEEVAGGLRATQGSLQSEALSRKLLENHIQTVTHIVKQLSLDIQVLERRTTQQDSVTNGTAMAVQTLEQKVIAFIGDLRGRVARCDSNICSLKADESTVDRQLIRLKQEVEELRCAVDARFKVLGDKLDHNLGRLEVALSEHSQGQRRSMSDLHAEIKLLEDKMSGELKEAKEEANSLRNRTDQELSSVQLCTKLQDQMLQAESLLTDQLRALEARMEQFETQLTQADLRHTAHLKFSETKLSKIMTSMESNLHEELQLLKQEYHKGFLSVHDAIGSLKRIGEIKSHLDKKEAREGYQGHLNQGGKAR